MNHPTKPLLLRVATRTVNDSNAATKQIYGYFGVDEGSDVFRHVLTGALLTRRMMARTKLDVA